MSSRTLVGVVLSATTIAGFGGTAFAGEWAPGGGKNGHTTPVKDYVARSICSFNGADEPDTTETHGPEGGDDEQWAMTPAGGNVQSGGQFVAMVAKNFGPGALAGGFGGFGGDCNPNSGHTEP